MSHPHNLMQANQAHVADIQRQVGQIRLAKSVQSNKSSWLSEASKQVASFFAQMNAKPARQTQETPAYMPQKLQTQEISI